MTLRVVHVDAGREWRGGQRQVFLLAQALRAAGAEPLVIGPADAPLVGRLRDVGLAAATVRMRGDWDLVAARRVRSIARAWRADVVHAHDARAHALVLAALAVPLARRDASGHATAAPPPVVVTRRVMRPPRYARLKYSSRVARFIAISHAIRDVLVASGISADRIEVVHSGVPRPVVDRPRDWRAERGWPADAIICGLVGAMTAEKGIAQLGAIAAHLPESVRRRIRLVLLGGGVAGGAGTLEGIAVYRAGFVEDIHAAMAGLDLLWHPSTSEGLGTSVIDAMALGVPPIAFATGGLSEVIESGRNGLVAPAGDSAAFAHAVARLIGDAALRHALASAGPARAAEFSVERMVAGTVAVYDRVRPASDH
jgi:glycosyltransferase involved in cell wall biosynthesis